MNKLQNTIQALREKYRALRFHNTLDMRVMKFAIGNATDYRRAIIQQNKVHIMNQSLITSGQAAIEVGEKFKSFTSELKLRRFDDKGFQATYRAPYDPVVKKEYLLRNYAHVVPNRISINDIDFLQELIRTKDPMLKGLDNETLTQIEQHFNNAKHIDKSDTQ